MQRYIDLRAKDVGRKTITLEPHRTLDDARNLMKRYNIGRIVVAEGNKPVGIFTEKDVAGFLFREHPARKLSEIRLDEVMTSGLITIAEEGDLDTAARLMLERGISSLIITDSKGSLKGIITKSDLVRAYADHFTGKNHVRDYMTKSVFTVAPDDTTHKVLEIMVTNKISRVVVVRDQKPAGIVTGRDLLPISALFGPNAHETIREAFFSRKVAGTIVPPGISAVFLARDVMKYDPLTITGESDLSDAAQIMVRNRISGLPVVDPSNNLVGIVTKTDVVRALASPGT